MMYVHMLLGVFIVGPVGRSLAFTCTPGEPEVVILEVSV